MTGFMLAPVLGLFELLSVTDLSGRFEIAVLKRFYVMMANSSSACTALKISFHQIRKVKMNDLFSRYLYFFN